jgi:hypothetical protein
MPEGIGKVEVRKFTWLEDAENYLREPKLNRWKQKGK